MDGADEAGIVGAHDVADFDRIVGIGHGDADQGLLPVSALPGGVAREAFQVVGDTIW